jgi:hypothetical protein
LLKILFVESVVVVVIIVVVDVPVTVWTDETAPFGKCSEVPWSLRLAYHLWKDVDSFAARTMATWTISVTEWFKRTENIVIKRRAVNYDAGWPYDRRAPQRGLRINFRFRRCTKKKSKAGCQINRPLSPQPNYLRLFCVHLFDVYLCTTVFPTDWWQVVMVVVPVIPATQCYRRPKR